MKIRKRQFTAVYRKLGKWYIGWVEEMPGVNTQGKTFIETKANLKEALTLILETNRFLNSQDRLKGKMIYEPVEVSF